MTQIAFKYSSYVAPLLHKKCSYPAVRVLRGIVTKLTEDTYLRLLVQFG